MSDQHSLRDDVLASLDEWDDMGAVERMRQDADYWVELARSLFEQLEALRPYVQHRSTCILNVSRSNLRTATWCDCGLTELLASNPASSRIGVHGEGMTAEDRARATMSPAQNQESSQS